MRLGLRREFYGVHGVEIQRRREQPHHQQHHHIGDGHEFRHVDPVRLARDAGANFFIGGNGDMATVEREKRNEINESEENVDRRQEGQYSRPTGLFA